MSAEHISFKINKRDLSCDMRFPTMWYVLPANAQTSLHIHAVWSEPLLVAWIFYDCYATDWTAFGVSKLKRSLHRLVWAYSCQNTTLFEITCCGSFFYSVLIFFSNSNFLVPLTLSILDNCNQVLWQTVKTQMKCHIRWHFISVCTLC